MSVALESGPQIILWIIISGLFVLKVVRIGSDWNFSRKNGCGKVTHLPTFAFGLDTLWDFVKSMNNHESMEFIRRWHGGHGRTFKLRLGRELIETIEPKNVQAILALQFKDFDLGSRNDAMSPLLGQGIFASDGAIWEHSRALVRPNFVRNQISDIAIYEKHVGALIKRIPRDESTVDLQDLFFRMTMDSATEFLFGHSTNTLGGESTSATDTPSKKFASDFNISQAGVLLRIRLGPLKGLYKNSTFEDATRDSREHVRRLVAGALEERAKDGEKANDKSYVFLHELAKQTQDEKLLTDQLLNILLAGRDTTAGLLSILFLLLAKRQDVWTKLREEVIREVGNEQPTFEQLKSMKYLTWVLNETLRLYPVVPANMRVANKNTTLPTGGGPNGDLPIFVSKGQEVMYSVYSMHRLPEFFGDDALEFKPERWENLRPGWAYLPFNGGPRVCIGQQFALTEAGYTIVRILQEFEGLDSRDPEPFQELLTLTLASNNGTKVALKAAA